VQKRFDRVTVDPVAIGVEIELARRERDTIALSPTAPGGRSPLAAL
jgi:hypothetical protein